MVILVYEFIQTNLYGCLPNKFKHKTGFGCCELTKVSLRVILSSSIETDTWILRVFSLTKRQQQYPLGKIPSPSLLYVIPILVTGFGCG